MNQQKKIKGFTLIELLIVIAIIGILTSIVLVSTRSGVDKAKRASALTTASSVLPEIVTCQDDGGGLSAYSTANVICSGAAGHSITWPNITTTQWGITAVAQTAPIPDNYSFTVTKPTGSALADMKCKLDTSMCCDVGSAGC